MARWHGACRLSVALGTLTALFPPPPPPLPATPPRVSQDSTLQAVPTRVASHFMPVGATACHCLLPAHTAFPHTPLPPLPAPQHYTHRLPTFCRTALSRHHPASSPGSQRISGSTARHSAQRTRFCRCHGMAGARWRLSLICSLFTTSSSSPLARLSHCTASPPDGGHSNTTYLCSVRALRAPRASLLPLRAHSLTKHALPARLLHAPHSARTTAAPAMPGKHYYIP